MKSVDWAKVEEGTRVVIKREDGQIEEGVFLHVCGGREKGKIRVCIDGDSAKYREIHAAEARLPDAAPANAPGRKAPSPGKGFESVIGAMRAGKTVTRKDGTSFRYDGGQIVRVAGQALVPEALTAQDILDAEWSFDA